MPNILQHYTKRIKITNDLKGHSKSTTVTISSVYRARKRW